ncbi:MAG TPA: hypothetical protein VMT76_10815 [Puia sp.]|nr:hypothetical protein [Puia sp.]
MKRFFFLMLMTAGTLFVSSAYSQVRIHANINLPLPPLPPIPHVHVYAPVPQVVYQDNYQPASQYYDGYGTNRVVVTTPAYGYDRCYSDRDYRYRRYDERGYRDHDDYRRHEYREHHDRDDYRRGW